ncbi:uncharacterized protein [Chelonus insularis]|uniref:uncharacterized protein n=1 Tax=Chelonus insularis TaxID=460826 RepID=UPI00158AFB0E|nr:uncharacterized protein LOC118065633 [Chelonus insularis]
MTIMDLSMMNLLTSQNKDDNDDNDFDVFSEQLKCIDFSSLLEPNHLENPEWSDTRLKEMSKEYKFAMNEWDSKIAKIMLTRFFNFYFTGRTPSDDNVIATVHDCVSIAHVKGHRLFRPRSTGNIYYTKNTSMPTSVTSEIRGISKKKPVPPRLSVFHDYIKTAVDKFNTTSTTNSSEKELLGLAGFLALTLCQFATRNIEHIMETFRDVEYRKTLESVAGWRSDKPFAFPVKEALETCSSCLRQSTRKTRALFCVLADEMANTYAPNFPEPENRRYLGTSVLFHTGYYGLGMIKMIKDVCELLEAPWNNIRPLVTEPKTNSSCESIDRFIKNNLKDGEHGYAWARIIHEDFLPEYSYKNNNELCIVMIAILEHKKGPIVWNAKWIDRRLFSFQSVKKRANAIYQLKRNLKKKKSTDCNHSLAFCTCCPLSSKTIKILKYLIVQIEKNNVDGLKKLLESLKIGNSSKTSSEDPTKS